MFVVKTTETTTGLAGVFSWLVGAEYDPIPMTGLAFFPSYVVDFIPLIRYKMTYWMCAKNATRWAPISRNSADRNVHK